MGQRERKGPNAAPPPRSEVLPESASLLLDVLRFALAVLVVLGHVSEPPFSHGWPNLIGWANGAVPGFFVLSGFVIRFVTQSREKEARRYWISRASRMYSVVIPAIILTVICDAISRKVNLPFYTQVNFPQKWTELPLRVGVHLLFLTQAWGNTTLLLSNRPFWSLGYEVPYYVLFGLLHYLRGWGRAFAVMGVAVLFGPQVLFLFPLWWAGCWLYDLWQWSRGAKRALWVEVAMGVAAAAALLLLLWPVEGASLFHRINRLPNPLALIHQQAIRATTFEYAAGLFFFLMLLLLLTVSDGIALARKTRWAKSIRFVAEGTFTLYLFHYPVLVLLGSLGFFTSENIARRVLAVAVICVFAILCALPVDALKRRFRGWFSRWISEDMSQVGRSSNSDQCGRNLQNQGAQEKLRQR